MPKKISKKWSFVVVEEQIQNIIILGEKRKRGRVRAEPSDPKRTKGYFRCRVSIDRSTHPPPFIRRAGCHWVRVPWEVPTPIAQVYPLRVSTSQMIHALWSLNLAGLFYPVTTWRYFCARHLVAECNLQFKMIGFQNQTAHKIITTQNNTYDINSMNPPPHTLKVFLHF